MSSFFVNIHGYELQKIWGSEPAKYDFSLKAEPLTYVDSNGRTIQPNRHYVTDMGSIPLCFQVFFPKDEFLLSYIFHDSAYAFGGFWEQGEFVERTRKQTDDRLLEMILVEGGGWLEAHIVWFNVRAFGWASWCKGDAKTLK